MSETIRRYAAAFHSAIERYDAAETICDDAERFAALIDREGELRRLFASPAFSIEEKRTVFAALAQRLTLPVPVADLFIALIEARRTAALTAVARTARALYRRGRGLTEIELTTAGPIDEEDLATLRPALERRFGTRLLIHRTVDPALLGGIVVRHGNTVLDASIRNYLAILDRTLREGDRYHA